MEDTIEEIAHGILHEAYASKTPMQLTRKQASYMYSEYKFCHLLTEEQQKDIHDHMVFRKALLESHNMVVPKGFAEDWIILTMTGWRKRVFENIRDAYNERVESDPQYGEEVELWDLLLEEASIGIFQDPPKAKAKKHTHKHKHRSYILYNHT